MKSICLRGKIQLLAHLFAPCEFTEKCFAVFNQSNHMIYLTCYRSLFSRDFLLSFLLWYHFKILVKSRGGGTTFLCLASSVNIWLKYFFFQLKAKYPVFHFLDLDGTILNLIQPKINKKMSKSPSSFKVFLILASV